MGSIGLGSKVLASTGTTLPNVSVTHLLFQMVIAIGVIGGGIWLFGKFMQRRRSGLLGTGSKSAVRGLTVLSRTSLGKDHHLAIVAWGERQFLVGISGTTVTLLAEAESSNGDAPLAELAPSLRTVPERPLPTPSQRSSGRPSFVEALRTATLRG